MAATRLYVVEPGDYLDKIALLVGAPPKDIWDLPENKELRALRMPDLLCAGDVLHVPDQLPTTFDLTGGQTNTFEGNVPKRSVVLRFLDEDGTPLGEEPCEVLGVGETLCTSTKRDGTLEFKVPVLLREAQVYFTERQRVFPIRVGELDPVHERSGQTQRFRNLGLLDDEPDSVFSAEELFEMTVAEFQRSKKLSATGQVDDATRDALEKDHGC